MNSLELFPFIVKTLSALALVVGIMIVSVYFLKKIMKKAGGNVPEGDFIKILSTKYIGPKNSIMLVEVSEHIMVIGLSGNQMSLLTTIEDRTFRERLQENRRRDNTAASFSDQLALCKAKLLSLGSFVGKG